MATDRKYFFITALPRSRTAWLANFFSQGSSFCLHDAIKSGWTAGMIAEQMEEAQAGHAVPLQYLGDSDTGLGLRAGELVKLFPEARWLFVRNTPERSAASYRRAFPPNNPYPGTPLVFDVELAITEAQRLYERAWNAVAPEFRREVRLAELDAGAMMREVQEWLTPGRPWDEARWRMLDAMKVEVIAKKTKVAPLPEHRRDAPCH